MRKHRYFLPRIFTINLQGKPKHSHYANSCAWRKYISTTGIFALCRKTFYVSLHSPYHSFPFAFGCATTIRFASRHAIMVTYTFSRRKESSERDTEIPRIQRRFSAMEGRICSHEHERTKKTERKEHLAIFSVFRHDVYTPYE